MPFKEIRPRLLSYYIKCFKFQTREIAFIIVVAFKQET